MWREARTEVMKEGVGGRKKGKRGVRIEWERREEIKGGGEGEREEINGDSV